MERVRNALRKSWAHDPAAFMYEMVGVFFTILGSLLLAFTAKDPNMLIVFPIYEIGSVSLLIAYYKREMVWSIGLTGYFVVINFVGFCVALF